MGFQMIVLVATEKTDCRGSRVEGESRQPEGAVLEALGNKV